ncbi:MAG: acylphosphatase [Clostridiales Family XIII bacterium]|jgi:acylphosphatase|nr:acylphosphatase [Clostridiales Family XIII bacterium]
MIRKVRIRVYGRVQGVGFRWSVKQVADSIGIYGCVRNEYDGSVSIEAVSSVQNIKLFINTIQTSTNQWARVDSVEVYDDDEIRERSTFAIVH